MRSGISIIISSADRQRLEAIVSDPKSAQKHVWRAKIILLTDDGAGTAAHGRERQVEDLRVALAGTVHGDGRRGSDA